MVLQQTTAPSNPIPLDEAKTFFRIIGDDEDAVIETLLQMAVDKAVDITNRALYSAEFNLFIDNWERTKLPRPPFVQVLKVEYKNRDLAWVEWGDYKTDNKTPTELHFISLPGDWCGEQESIKIHYKAGYEELPAQIKQWCLVEALTAYENREKVVVNGSVDTNLSRHYDRLLDSYRIISL